MNEASHQKVIQPLYPAYQPVDFVEDEINLVDVWITLKQKRSLFFKVFPILLVVGIIYTFFIFQEKHALVTTIQIGSIEQEGNIHPIEPPESLLSKINNAMAPQVLQGWIEKNPQFKAFETEISNPKKSDIILITNKIIPDELAHYKIFQQSLAEKVVDDHEKQIGLLQSDLVVQLNQARNTLARLRDPETLKNQLSSAEINLEAAQVKLKKLEQSYTKNVEQGESGLERKIKMENMKTLKPENEGLSDPLLELQYEQLLLDSQLSIDQQNLLIAKTKLNIDRIKKDYQQSIEQQQFDLADLETRLNSYNKTRVVGQPILTINPVGLSRNILLVVVLIIASVISFVVILVSIFKDKVQQREIEIS